MQEKTFKIGEVAEMLELKSYVLRYWETEFPQLYPLRTEKGQRLYTDSHINLLRNIQDLLHVKGMTIEGARRELAAGYNIESIAKEIPPEIEAGAAVDNIAENKIISTQNISSAYSVNNEYNASNKDELSSIFNELTTIRKILQGNQ